MITHTSNSLQIPVKTRQSQSYKLKKNCQKFIFWKMQETLHATHFLKLLDKIYEYEMDPNRTVGATERTQDAGRTDWRMDRQMDRRTEWNQYTQKKLCCAGDIMIWIIIRNHTSMVLAATIFILTALQWCYMGTKASQITSHSSACSIVCLSWHQRNIKAPQIRQWPLGSPHKGLVMQKMSHVITSCWSYHWVKLSVDKTKT